MCWHLEIIIITVNVCATQSKYESEWIQDQIEEEKTKIMLNAPTNFYEVKLKFKIIERMYPFSNLLINSFT